MHKSHLCKLLASIFILVKVLLEIFHTKFFYSVIFKQTKNPLKRLSKQTTLKI
jgi:hypothetical protein